MFNSKIYRLLAFLIPLGPGLCAQTPPSYLAPAHQVIKAEAQLEGKKIYQVSYHTDAFGRRHTPASGQDLASPFALFFGCSFIWGEGVADDETIPFYFAQERPDFVAYNYGIRGAGPHVLLSMMKASKLEEQIGQKKGLGIYYYVTGHLNRAIGAAQEMLYSRDAPYYFLDEQGELKEGGTFLEGRPFLTRLFWLISKSGLLRKLKRNMPIHRPQHTALVCKIIEGMKQQFLRSFPDSQFVVVIKDDQDGPDISPCLERLKITWAKTKVDFQQDQSELRQQNLGEGHMNARGNLFWTKKIIEALKSVGL